MDKRVGRGGMAAKVDAARFALDHGVPSVICNGHDPEILSKIIQGLLTQHADIAWLPTMLALLTRTTLNILGKILLAAALDNFDVGPRAIFTLQASLLGPSSRGLTSSRLRPSFAPRHRGRPAECCLACSQASARGYLR